MVALLTRLKPCGPNPNLKASDRLHGILLAKNPDAFAKIASAWPILAPIFGASPYLASLARRDPDGLARFLSGDPDHSFEGILRRAEAAGDLSLNEGMSSLRQRKAEAHLLTAICDLCSVWDLDAVTGAMTRFADRALQAALKLAAQAELEAGRLTHLGGGAEGPVPGLFCIAMGKHGAFELNYSSDIDISVFFEPDLLAVADRDDAQSVAVRLTNRLSQIMQERTVDGYVFRVDLRLRPDPSSTPLAVRVPAALDYYGSVGQNWERAAFIKARACAGDLPCAEAFLEELTSFVWRKNLDFEAISDIQAIKRQIHVHKVDDRLTAKGVDVKLGRGGIREIEFYVQTQQLILGGRNPSLRSPRTLDSLAALTLAGHVTPAARQDMAESYETLRAIEHRIQMIADEQTHKLPESDIERRRVAVLMGQGRLASFDAAVERTLRTVNGRYSELFPNEEPLSSRFGSLIFTGVDDDPETLKTLAKIGMQSPGLVSQTIRSWHHGNIAATRTERGRELFTRLAPRLLDAAQATGAADVAFKRFAEFFSRLSSGVQLQALFLANPKLFELVVQVMAFAPRLADTLARRPAALDAMLDGDFFASFSGQEDRDAIKAGLARANGFEAAMDAARRIHREQAFRIGVQVMSATADADAAGRAFADLADACVSGLAPVALAEAERLGGTMAGDVAVVALGKCGSREMSAGSDLDLMTLYAPQSADGLSNLKGWTPDVFYGRFTQRLIAALSTPTGEGDLYEVDMQLRPSGTKGPVAVSMAAFEDYYAREAETWELLALTRARVVWATSPDFAMRSGHAIETALRKPRKIKSMAKDTRDMRDLLTQERPPSGPWDLKLSPGGLVDIEFAAQYLQIAHAAKGGPLRVNTAEALEAMGTSGLVKEEVLSSLRSAWALQQNLTQILKLALTGQDNPEDQPLAFRKIMARVAKVRDFRTLQKRLAQVQMQAHLAFLGIVGP